MMTKKKTRNQRALHEETMIIFLKLIGSAKRKLSVHDCIEKIQIKNPTQRSIRIQNTINHLKKDDYIRVERNKYLKLTEKGSLYLESIIQKQKTHWDKRFRIILLNSIQTTANNHTYIRTKIKEYGFVQLVRGAWVYPYVCDAFINLLRIEYKLDNVPLYLVTQDTEHMSLVRKHFRLR
jgi:DNA-binding transcriptional regulator PaaX